MPKVIQEQLLDGPRYSLRHRKAAQLKPYTVDQLKYKQALRANPDAIVKFKNLRNHHHHPEDRYEEDGETQQDSYVGDGNNDEDADWEERERRRHQRPEGTHKKKENALSECQQISYSEILQDLSSTDDEEANEKHTLSKEAQKIIKEREKLRKIREKELRRREQELRRQQILKRKPFPTFNRKASNTEEPSNNDAVLEDVRLLYANISIVF